MGVLKNHLQNRLYSDCRSKFFTLFGGTLCASFTPQAYAWDYDLIALTELEKIDTIH